MIIETERLILRPFKEADKTPYAALNANPAVMHYFRAPKSPEESDAHIHGINSSWENGDFNLLAAELKHTKQFIGFIGLAPIPKYLSSAMYGHPNVEIGWRLHPDTWGKGLAPEGARACLIYAWEVLELNEVVSFTAKTNTPSQRVMEKIGMSRDVNDDFVHPKMPTNHSLAPHVLYRIANLAAKSH